MFNKNTSSGGQISTTPDPTNNNSSQQQVVVPTTKMTDGIISPGAGSTMSDGILPVAPSQTVPPAMVTPQAPSTPPSVSPPSPANTSPPKPAVIDKKEGMDIMTRLTQRSNKVLSTANQKALELKNTLVDSEHLLFGLLADQEIFNLLSSLNR